MTTYSKKSLRPTTSSRSSDERHHRKRRVTLTSPVRGDSLPTSPSSISLSSFEQVDDEDDEDDRVSQAATNAIRSKARRHTEPSPTHELAFAASSDRAASPVSSSEHDSISDEDLAPAGRDGRKRLRRATKPQTLSKLRKSLNFRPKKLQPRCQTIDYHSLSKNTSRYRKRC